MAMDFFQKEVKKTTQKTQQQQQTMYVSIQSEEFPGDQWFFLCLPPQIYSAVPHANTQPPRVIYEGPLKVTAAWVTQLPQQLLVHSK